MNQAIILFISGQAIALIGAGFTVTSGDFQSTDSTQLTGARVSGTLPNITFLKLASGSDMVDTGTDVGYGNDLGALQYSASAPPPTPGPTQRRLNIGRRLIIQ